MRREGGKGHLPPNGSNKWQRRCLLRPGELRRPRCPGRHRAGPEREALELPRGTVRGAGSPQPGTGTEVRGTRGTLRATRRARPLSPHRNVVISCSKRCCGYCVSVGTAGSSLAFLASYTSRLSLAKNLENASGCASENFYFLLCFCLKKLGDSRVSVRKCESDSGCRLSSNLSDCP